MTNAIGPAAPSSAPPTAGTPDDERRHLSRLRVAVTLFFGLDGFLFAGWVVRIPAVKSQTDASASALGLALLGVSAGAVVTMILTGRLCRAFGARPVTVVCSALLSIAVALPAHTHSATALGLVLVVFGIGYGGQNVAMNAAAVDIVAALRRPVISSFHAVYSLGGMLGAALGGLVASHLSPAVHLGALAVIGLAATAVLTPFLLRGPDPVVPETVPPAGPGTAVPAGSGATVPSGSATPPAAPRPGSPPPSARGTSGKAAGAVTATVVLFGVIAGCTAYGEGSMSDWSAVHLSQDLGAAPGLAAVGYSVFALAMTVGRLSGTAVQERFGRTGTLVVGGLLAAAGMLLGALAPVTWLVFAGFVVMGLGLSNIFPVAIGRAGALAGPNGVAVASTLGYGGLLIGPPAIGFLSDWLSMPVALTTVSLLAALAAVLGYVARDAGRRPSRA